MPDEPSTGELSRRFVDLQTEINRRFDALSAQMSQYVPQMMFDAERRYTAGELTRVQSELQQVRTERDKLEDDFQAYQRDERDRRERERQARLYSAVIPVLIAVVTSAIAIWAVVAG